MVLINNTQIKRTIPSSNKTCTRYGHTDDRASVLMQGKATVLKYFLNEKTNTFLSK